MIGLLATSTLIATVYGFGESYCGDYGQPRPCSIGAVTASGEMFDPMLPTAAIALPRNQVLRPFWAWLRVGNGDCQKVWVNDKKNERYIGDKDLDLTPAAVHLLTGQTPTQFWSGVVKLCRSKDIPKAPWLRRQRSLEPSPSYF